MNVSNQSASVESVDQPVERSVMVVEDDVNTARALSSAIASLGFTVSVANSIQQARSLMAEQPSDVVVLDVSLPDGDGLQLMEESASKFVVITGDDSQETAVRSLRLQAVDFLLKPISLDDLRTTLIKVSRHFALQGEISSNNSAEDIRRADKSPDVGNADDISEVSATDDEPPVSDITKNLVGQTFWAVEKKLLQATLDHHDGDKKLAAKTLGISLKTLYNRLNAYSIDL